MTKAHYFWTSMHFVELYSDRLSFIFLDSDLLHCLMWHFSFLLLCFSFLVSFTSSITAFCGVSSLSPLTTPFLWSSYLLLLVPPFSVKVFLRFPSSQTSSFYPSSSCFEVKGMWLLWWKNKCLLLIGEQPSTIGILGEM